MRLKMKASIEWLKDYSDIDVSSKELGDILTMTGSKVETIDSKGNDIKNVVVGKILEIKKHPDADKLVVTKVDVGEEKIQIVTGANNIKVNDIVPIAKNGAELPGGKSIKTGALRGVESCGMMCSVGELGLELSDYPNQIEHGIMILPEEYEKYLGENIVDVLNLREDIIDFEITPNRPDCLSIEGLGRETAISLGKEFKNPRKNLDNLNIENKEEIEGLKVSINDSDLCYRYIARVVKNVKIGNSPEWLVRRLKAVGVRSINNIVDITNYVMLELGQPMHAFDINSIEGKQIIVRRAKDGEKITTLDGIEHELDNSMLVIADSKKPVAIAGVMGGENSEIEENTTTIVLESAVFNGGSVRKTAKKVGLRTESSSRFEKGLPAENALRAINRAVELIEMLGAGEAICEKIDVYPIKQTMPEIELEPDKINALLGLNLTREEMVSILEKVECKVNGNKVIPPFFRQDIERSADLAEEIVRFYGYDKLETSLVKADTTIGVRNKLQKIQDRIKEEMVSKGFSEIYTYAFINENDLDKINVPETSELRSQIINIRNPLSEDYKVMRTTTIASMMQTLATNYNNKNANVRLYDLSRIYKNDKSQIENGTNPTEDFILTLGMYGKDADFYTIKGLVENVLWVSGIAKYDIQRVENNTSYHPGRTAEFKVGIDSIATFGEIHPLVTENYGINERVYIAEINVTKITKYARTNKKYESIAKFPAVERDISLIVDEYIEVRQIEKIIEKRAKKLIESIKLFDIYRSDKLEANKKSVAYSLVFRAKDRTLTDNDINPIMEAIISDLENSLNAELRK